MSLIIIFKILPPKRIALNTSIIEVLYEECSTKKKKNIAKYSIKAVLLEKNFNIRILNIENKNKEINRENRRDKFI